MTATLHHPRYRLDRLVATGGMGEVWAATDTLLEREVAVKLLKREYAEDAVFRARFAGEARHAGSLQHPHVATVLDYGEIAGDHDVPVPFLVMELVDGQPLSALLAGGTPLEPEVAADLVAQAGEGVAAAHALGIVHRDVKPGNLLITGEGQVKVTDFGVARAADTVPLTMTGHIVGTPHYLSPEQAQGEVATPASDVYSLGIVLYECLVGARPFVGDSPVATALMQIRDPLPAFPDSVPERLQHITRVATAKSPAARYSTAAAFAAALRDETPETRTFLIPADPTETGGPSAAGAIAATPLAVGGGPAEGLRRRPGRALTAALALLLVLGGGWAIDAATDDEPQPEPPAAAPTGDDRVRVRVRAAAYLGAPVAAAARQLRRRGFAVDPRTRANPGERAAGTVAAVTPHGLVDAGSEIVLAVWGPPPPVAEPAQGSGSSSGSGSGSDTGPRESTGSGTGEAPETGLAPGGAPGTSTPNRGPGNSGKGKGSGKSKGGGKGGGKGKGGKR